MHFGFSSACVGLQVGEPGLGKDVFIKNAFASYCADNNLSVNSCGPDVDLPTFQHCSSEFCTEINVDVDEGRTKIHYMVQVNLLLYSFLLRKQGRKEACVDRLYLHLLCRSNYAMYIQCLYKQMIYINIGPLFTSELTCASNCLRQFTINLLFSQLAAH